MKQILLLFFLLFLYSPSTYSQNLVPNPSFEDTVCLWHTPGTICETFQFYLFASTEHWYAPCGFIPQYYHFGYNYIDSIMTRIDVLGNPTEGIPKNLFTNNTFPRTGDAYAGIETYFYRYYKWNSLNDSVLYFLDTCYRRECVGVNLKSKLLADKCYKVQFYLSTANRITAFVMDGIDVSFSNKLDFSYINWAMQNGVTGDSLNFVSDCNCGNFNYTYKHFSPPALSSPRGVFFEDTTQWTKVEFEHIAKGDEVQMSIGLLRYLTCDSITFKFVSTTDTDAMGYEWTDSGQYNTVILFIDDVAIYPCDAPEYPAHIGIQDTCINKGMPIALGGEHQDEYLYWWYNANDSLISRQSSIIVYPTESTSYVLVQKDFKFDETRDTVHIKVGDCLPLPPDYSHYDFAIYPNPNQGDFQVRFNTAVPDGAVLELYDLLGRKIAKYTLSGSQNIANISGVDVAPAIYYATVIVPNVFSKSVKMVIIR
jgi:hypothetical protein